MKRDPWLCRLTGVFAGAMFVFVMLELITHSTLEAVALVSPAQSINYALCNASSFPHVQIHHSLIEVWVFAVDWDEPSSSWRILTHLMAVNAMNVSIPVNLDSVEAEWAALSPACEGRYTTTIDVTPWWAEVRCQGPAEPSLRLRVGSAVLPIEACVARNDAPVVALSHCGAPVLNDAPLDQIAPFIEHHAALGVGRFYVFDRYGRLQKVLQRYIDDGVVDYTPFPAPSVAIEKIWPLWDQTLLLELCRWRARGSSEWLTNVDLDEWIDAPDLPTWLASRSTNALSVGWVIANESSSATSGALPERFPTAWFPPPDTRRTRRQKLFIRPNAPAKWLVHCPSSADARWECHEIDTQPISEIKFVHYWLANPPWRGTGPWVSESDVLRPVCWMS